MKPLVLATLTALGCAWAAGADVQAQTVVAGSMAQSHREIVSLTDGWRFRQDNTLLGAEQPGFSDAGWERVSVPHTWNRVGHYIPASGDRVNTPEKINKTQGVGWYRLTFTAPSTFRGKRAWLQFEAASRKAEVWLNGVRLGEHSGGFSGFRLDATAALKSGRPNLLVVKTDNSTPTLRSATADVLPLAGDFFVHGGLYRPVSLIATDAVHLEMLDYGGPGVYASTRSIEGGQAHVSVRAKVRNDGRSAAPILVTARLVDAEGRVVAEGSNPVSVAAGRGSTVEHELTIGKARLWQGVEDPYLYRLVVELRSGGGQVLDRVDQAFGVRQMRFDPEKGFFLNGKPLRLRGVGLHQDLEGKGWAQSAADIEADIGLIREMGANSIRLTHYQHGQTVHELADRYGLILWDEIPLVTLWTLTRGQMEATSGLRANARQQLQELIRQNYNHPSVAVWGIANEVDFGASLPGFLTGDLGVPPDPLPLLRELNALAKAEDPTRPTTQANCCEGRLFAGEVEIPIVAPATELSGVNRYFGWYYGGVDDLGPHLDATHRKRPAQPLAVTEYGAGGAVTMHTDDPLGGPPDSRGRNQPEEYMSYIHEQAWATLKSKPYLWGTWLWNSTDFATTVRREGDANDINTKGLVTYDRKTKKDAFFFYKANWSDHPTLHINGRRYVDRAYRVTDVRVYSNAASTELTLNGRSLGRKTDCPQMTCVWEAVKLDLGENVIVAAGRFPSGDQQDRIVWRVAPDVVEAIRIDSGALMAAPAESVRFGSDAFFVGGKAGTVSKPADYGKAKVTKVIAGAVNSEVATTYRAGDFQYRIPLDNGRYKVTLTFVEPGAKAGERQFDVIANGKRKLDRLDVAAAAGAPLTAVVRSFPARVSAGRLDLEFRGRVGEAIVSSVEVSRR
ncbi:glycoside hydrolase family 2 TIM barrel-domain containing protein [Phenylobacterium sp. LjRoot225]|uniref:glycoside hydrolase family 2 TIM barrel-domain containing protein n=1 Tax=Phenylobacterium sp. LjRoot225 TaxID=3342285 RepID=UPI003F4F887D